MDKNSSASKRSLSSKNQNILLLTLGLLLFGVGIWLVIIYLNYYQDRFYPRTYLDDINISGLTRNEARIRVGEHLQVPLDLDSIALRLVYAEKTLEIPLSTLDISDDLDLVIGQAFEKRQTEHWSTKLRQVVKQHFEPQRYYIGLTYETDAIREFIESFKTEIDLSGEKPSAVINGQQSVLVNPGQTSQELLVEETWQKLHQQILSRRLRELHKDDFTLEVVVDQAIVALTQEEEKEASTRAQKFLGKQLSFSYDYQKINLDARQLLNLLHWPQGVDQDALQKLLEELQIKVNRPSRDAVFQYDPQSLAVTEFSPDQDGLELDEIATKQIILDFIAIADNEGETLSNNKQETFDLPLRASRAKLTLADSNDLGIQEIIGFGESWYDHSIPNRIYNVDLTASRITNYIVKPGAEYSFNKALGEVSSKTGFRDAYIIEAGQTKLAPGGGVCQVSSTLFRSLLDSGVKISKRLPHAYRVSYYEIGNEPGFDATVYAGEVDLRFINDTPGHILISCESDAKNLYMFCKLYGTNDGRTTEIVNYKKWGASPPLPTVYIDDPSLAPGQLKQIDWSASGIRTEFTHIVRDRNGEVMREDRYQSNYRPWAAKYLRGI